MNSNLGILQEDALNLLQTLLKQKQLKKELLFKAQGSFVVNFHELLEGVWDNVLGQVREILFV